MIEKQLLRLNMKCVSFIPPLIPYYTQMINHFLNSRISANHIKWRDFQPFLKSSKRGFFFYCKISFAKILVLFIFIRSLPEIQDSYDVVSLMLKWDPRWMLQPDSFKTQGKLVKNIYS